jgi:general stress protein YciG
MTKKLPPKALEFFREEGRKGGLNRAANLSKEQRAEIARKAALKRWENRKSKGL